MVDPRKNVNLPDLPAAPFPWSVRSFLSTRLLPGVDRVIMDDDDDDDDTPSP